MVTAAVSVRAPRAHAEGPHPEADPHKAMAALIADPLKELGKVGEASEKAAGVLLHSIARAEIRTLKEFDACIKLAYDANGWHATAGRPGRRAQMEDRRSVPHTVRTYVWEIRSAYRLGIEVWAQDTMYALRQAKRKIKDEAAEGTEDNVRDALPEEFQGVRLTAVNRFNGAVFHDVCVVGALLPKRKRLAFAEALDRVKSKWVKELPPKLRPDDEAGE